MVHTLRRCLQTPSRARGRGLQRQEACQKQGMVSCPSHLFRAWDVSNTRSPQAGVHGSEGLLVPGHTRRHHFLELLSLPRGLTSSPRSRFSLMAATPPSL